MIAFAAMQGLFLCPKFQKISLVIDGLQKQLFVIVSYRVLSVVLALQPFLYSAVLRSRIQKKLKNMNVVSNKWVNLAIGIVAIAGAILLSLVVKEAIDKAKAKKAISKVTDTAKKD